MLFADIKNEESVNREINIEEEKVEGAEETKYSDEGKEEDRIER